MSAGEPQGLVGALLLDRYRIDSELGRGGMATILLATDTRLDRPVVVKVPHLDTLGDAALRERFLTEVRDLAQHEHPHILAILDQGEHHGIPFAVLQYLGGGDLTRRLHEAGGREDVEAILEWLHPVARALDYVHARGCLHRDVKAGNILFDESGHPFLSDFGIATALDVVDADAPTVASREHLTSAGSFVGSAAYAPPEAIDRVFTPAYDQYSLATVVYVALTGHLPFEGRTNEAILIAKARSDVPPLDPSRLRRPLPAACEAVLRRALARDPAARFPSCVAFAEAFDTAARGGGGRRRRAALAAGVAALVVAAGMATWPTLTSWLERWGAGRAPFPAASERVASPPGGVVRLGSTESEIAEALALCRAHGSYCDEGELAGETLREARVAPFAIGRLEVRNGEFAAWAEETGIETLAERRGYSWDGPTRRRGLSWRTPAPGRSAADHPDWPVVHVTAAEAQRYCAHHGGRLPSADEWEHQARGPQRRIFPWGDDWSDERLRFTGSSELGLEAVGSHPSGATPEGVLDLAGSVWEWTSSEGDDGVIVKGGSWDTRNPAHFRAAALAEVEADETASDLGFRCVWPD